MNNDEKKKLNKYINVAYIGLFFIFISMATKYINIPGQVFFFLIGVVLIFIGIGLTSINYHRWK